MRRRPKPRASSTRALADVLGAPCLDGDGKARHVARDGKTTRASKNGEGKAAHVFSAFRGGLQTVLSRAASRGKGLAISAARRLLERLGLRGEIVTIFWQKSIPAKIAEGGGDVFPVKDNQKSRKDAIETAYAAPVFPLSRWDGGPRKARGRIERRAIDVLPATPPAWAANGRHCAKSAARGVGGNARRTANGRSRKRRSSL